MTHRSTSLSRLARASGLAAAASLALTTAAPAAVIVNDTFEDLNDFTIDANPDGDMQQNVVLGTLGDVGNPDSGGFVRRADGASDEQLGYLIRSVDATGFEALTISLDAAARTGSTWEGPEFISFEIDTGSGFQTILQDFGLPGSDVVGTGDGTFVTLSQALPAAAEDSTFDLRLGFNVGFYNATASSREIYYFDNLVIEGTVIPEPASAVAAVAGLGLLGLRRRSR
jgi:hypothetical protein